MLKEIARVVPFYDGIQHLKKTGDAFQYGGPHLCADWKFATPDGKAHFRAVRLPPFGVRELAPAFSSNEQRTPSSSSDPQKSDSKLPHSKPEAAPTFWVST